MKSSLISFLITVTLNLKIVADSFCSILYFTFRSTHVLFIKYSCIHFGPLGYTTLQLIIAFFEVTSCNVPGVWDDVLHYLGAIFFFLFQTMLIDTNYFDQQCPKVCLFHTLQMIYNTASTSYFKMDCCDFGFYKTFLYFVILHAFIPHWRRLENPKSWLSRLWIVQLPDPYY